MPAFDQRPGREHEPSTPSTQPLVSEGRKSGSETCYSHARNQNINSPFYHNPNRMWKFVDSASTDYTSILLVEDDQNDAFLFERALNKAGIAGSFSHLRDGEEAINYFKAIAVYADRVQPPFPSLLVTDLKMPKVSGFDLLAWIQNEIQPRTFPIIVLTSSVLPEDKSKALGLGADHYWVKPSEPTELVALLQSFKAR